MVSGKGGILLQFEKNSWKQLWWNYIACVYAWECSSPFGNQTYWLQLDLFVICKKHTSIYGQHNIHTDSVNMDIARSCDTTSGRSAGAGGRVDNIIIDIASVFSTFFAKFKYFLSTYSYLFICSYTLLCAGSFPTLSFVHIYSRYKREDNREVSYSIVIIKKAYLFVSDKLVYEAKMKNPKRQEKRKKLHRTSLIKLKERFLKEN